MDFFVKNLNTNNFFSFYGLPVSFLTNTAALKKSYLDYSRRLHPDFYTHAAAEEQEIALQLSTFNNQAYQTLSDFDSRMAYILQMKGILNESDEARMGQNLPSAFLMEMMDMNEAIDDLKTSLTQDANNDITKGVEGLLSQVDNLEKEALQGIMPLLENYSDGNEKEDFWREIKFFLYKKRYLLRIQKTLRTFAPQLT